MTNSPNGAAPARSDHRLPAPSLRSWRVTTAVRVFALALATGQVVGAGTLGAVGIVLLALVPVVVACCAIELQEDWQRAPWMSHAEGAATAVVIGLAGGPVEPLLICLAVPPVVAGFRHGASATVGASTSNAAAVLATGVVAQAFGHVGLRVGAVLPWLVIGLGAGLLAASQTRSVRRLEAAQAPYAAAHRLVGQLHTLAHQLPLDLDVSSHARAMQASLCRAVGADRCVVLVRSGTSGLEVLATDGVELPTDELMARRCVARGRAVHQHGVLALPLRVGDHVFGAVLLGRRPAIPQCDLGAVQKLADEQAIRLDTALLVDGVRALATHEERNRLARDIHDGLAQQVVALGYLADDLAALSEDPVARQGADDLRAGVTQLVDTLRFSVFDLRHDVGDAGGLSIALSEYARQLESRSDLTVHLTLDESGTRLPRRIEDEVLRIAMEALGNAHRHAGAVNLWVSLRTSGSAVWLVVEDDGVGGATPRAGHYGLHTMRERAAHIDAELEVGDRSKGGTVVTLRSRPAIDPTPGGNHDDQRLARR